jgi:hypothetical protein
VACEVEAAVADPSALAVAKRRPALSCIILSRDCCAKVR